MTEDDKEWAEIVNMMETERRHAKAIEDFGGYLKKELTFWDKLLKWGGVK